MGFHGYGHSSCILGDCSLVDCSAEDCPAASERHCHGPDGTNRGHNTARTNVGTTASPHRPNNGPLDLSKHHTLIGPGLWALDVQRVGSRKSSPSEMMKRVPSGLDTSTSSGSTTESQNSPASEENMSPGGRTKFDGQRVGEASNSSPATVAADENKSNAGSGNESFDNGQTAYRG